ncbi:MAG: D-alanyl-lipoteichoic acid biosynthesis protein DltD [Gemella haemolysans]|uniref:D-alanyl-lipoteichoic acid biosynthesis protein DltD n=1 Tax=Gemella haemolysans TaxID=1379 RepID=UPI002908E0E7|nr:D-alanyl-lipoteichoic acid biosynthesis protein DltD [Gemella haemolysans]MDU4714419.1 D-alanyl-lipoteichoic acid biosynthesis protein DltD [Gemella haemolysans]
MIRLKAFLISILLVLITLVILNKTYIKKIEDYYKVNDNSVRYSNAFEKYKSKDIILENITPKTLVLLGSSELTTTINEEYHPKKIFNYEDFNIMQIGVGNSQNIIHAATIGSIGNDIRNNEIVMIQSIQWFDNKNGILKDAFLSRISSEHVYNTMANDKISKETKEKFINRVIELSSTNKVLNKKYRSYKKYFVEEQGNFITGEFLKLDNYFYKLKNKYEFFKNKGRENYPLSGEKTPDYNWKELDEKVTEQAKERTNNNDYQIDNTYYDKYIKTKYDQLKNSSKNTKYDESKEYDDLDILLSIVKDLNLNMKFAILPANGKWSDYIGIDSEKRRVAYNNLKEIAKKNNIEVMDYSSKEYEEYYMYDAMHLGWRGWIDFERDLYKLKK